MARQSHNYRYTRKFSKTQWFNKGWHLFCSQTFSLSRTCQGPLSIPLRVGWKGSEPRAEVSWRFSPFMSLAADVDSWLMVSVLVPMVLSMWTLHERIWASPAWWVNWMRVISKERPGESQTQFSNWVLTITQFHFCYISGPSRFKKNVLRQNITIRE